MIVLKIGNELISAESADEYSMELRKTAQDFIRQRRRPDSLRVRAMFCGAAALERLFQIDRKWLDETMETIRFTYDAPKGR